jgi:uncharacterized DUF497 family protein
VARHEKFEWDIVKAAKNLARHRVSFEEAATVLADWFADRFHIEEFDLAQSTQAEDRWITLSSYPYDRKRMLVVCWMSRADLIGRPVTRIVSARPATRAERKQYESRSHRP